MRSEGARVLTPADIRNIRRYVQQKYADLPQERHAEIVDDAMERIILRQLPDFPEEMKIKLTRQLLKEVVLEQQRAVGNDHIFAACVTMDLTDRSLSEPLHAWTEQRLQSRVDAEHFHMLIKEAISSSLKQTCGVNQATLWEDFASRVRLAAIIGQAVPEPPARMADIVPLPVDKVSKPRPAAYLLLSLLLILGMFMYGWLAYRPAAPAKQPNVSAPRLPAPASSVSKDGLPPELRYTDVNRQKLAEYLNGRNSLLAEKSHMETIFSVAKKFDIHPLLLFAITGQEQGFIPKDHKEAKKIVNNPFNVYNSWRKYNTSLEESAAIAARTVNRLSKARPADTDPFMWINREYAEDPNWWKGVSSLFTTMKRHVGTSVEP
ncbi:hypothetical protein [Paenibacillus spongiae]|uniref:Mannosyl-glycoprotein endo-beta-N-acetylglucosamidase-like domain-containing protein n=1 Tax=Paenibacillus spongiae TaxID=2909671 RepID=A0ABY5S1B8_9BACL|nr:hypothetical protein [Paenibacillus spongiae]UVI27651.1 hypothetical protein L1F29_19485 [Paenibacillus spongiae]